MNVDLNEVNALRTQLDPAMLERVDAAAEHVVAAKERGGRVAVVTGSGPNLHEGVTTLIAELMRLGVIDAVTTSSAVVAHEMGGTLDKVKRFPGDAVGIAPSLLPRGGEFELTMMDDATLAQIARPSPARKGKASVAAAAWAEAICSIFVQSAPSAPALWKETCRPAPNAPISPAPRANRSGAASHRTVKTHYKTERI